MKNTWLLTLFALCFCASLAHAQGGGAGDGGCDTSPENPTVVLAAIASTGAGLAALRVRLRARKNTK